MENTNKGVLETFYTFERVGRILGCSPEQIRLWKEKGLNTFTPEHDRTFSRYPYRIWESDLLAYFQCESLEDFKKLKYRG